MQRRLVGNNKESASFDEVLVRFEWPRKILIFLTLQKYTATNTSSATKKIHSVAVTC